MASVVVDQQDCQVGVEREVLVVAHAGWERPQRVPLAQVDSLVIQARLQLDSHVFTQCAAHGVRVVMIPPRRSGSAAMLCGIGYRSAHRRLQQYQLWQSERLTLQVCRNLVCQRAHHQAALLEEAAALRPGKAPALELAVMRLRSAVRGVPAEYGLSQWRGIEGAGAALFFSAYQQLFAPSLGFVNRNRRPPQDPVNATLSLGYTLLHHLVHEAVLVAGLDAFLGTLHALHFGRESLVCDLVELQRHRVERWVWRLFAEQVLVAEDFGASEGWPCRLTKAGRVKFYKAWSALQHELWLEANHNTRLLVSWLDRVLPMQTTESGQVDAQAWRSLGEADADAQDWAEADGDDPEDAP